MRRAALPACFDSEANLAAGEIHGAMEKRAATDGLYLQDPAFRGQPAAVLRRPARWTALEIPYPRVEDQCRSRHRVNQPHRPTVRNWQR